MATDEMLSAQLMKAAKTGNTKEAKKLLHKGALFTKDEYGNNALHEAAWNGHSDVTKLLLKSSCFVDSLNKNFCTPLHLATQNAHGKAIQTLLKFKADMTILNQQGEAALHLAVKYSHLDLFPLFAAAKADFNIETKDGYTPLHIAAKHGNVAILRALLLLGADPHKLNKEGVSPAGVASEYGQQDAVNILKHSDDITSSSALELSLVGRTRKPLRSVWKPAKNVWQHMRRRSRSGSRDNLTEELHSKDKKRLLDWSTASTTALAGSQSGSPVSAPIRRPTPYKTRTRLSSSNEECYTDTSAKNDDTIQTRRCTSLEEMLDKDNTPALAELKSAPKQTSTPIQSPNNDCKDHVTMVPVKFGSPTHEKTRTSPQSDAEKKANKKTIINSVPLEINRLHEPNIEMEPKKSILAQPPRDKRKAEIQEELDTMKTAFEIRLSQIEKRYQRQLWLATEQANMERYQHRAASLPYNGWGGNGQHQYHQPSRGVYHHQKPPKRLSSLPAAENTPWQVKKRLFSNGYSSEDEYSHNDCSYLSPHYYDSDDSLSDQLSPDYAGDMVFPEDETDSTNNKPWFEDDSPTSSIRSGKSGRESKKISPHEYSETKKPIREKLAHFHEKIRQHYLEKADPRAISAVHRYRQHIDQNDNVITTTRLHQLEQRIQELETSMHNQTLV